VSTSSVHCMLALCGNEYLHEPWLTTALSCLQTIGWIVAAAGFFLALAMHKLVHYVEHAVRL